MSTTKSTTQIDIATRCSDTAYNPGMVRPAMTRGLAVFAIGSIALIWLAGIAAYLLSEPLGSLAVLLSLPIIVIPFCMAYLGHHLSGGVGNPFRGLVLGSGLWILIIWLLGLVAALAAVIVGLGLGWQTLDPSMSDFIALQQRQAGQAIPAGQQGALRIGGYISAFAAPTIGVLIGAAIGSLSTLSWYGWFLRRALVLGRTNGMLVTASLLLLSGLAGGLVENPAFGDLAVLTRMLLIGSMTVCMVPATLWIFFRSKSAVLPALAQAAFSGGLQGIMPFLSGGQPWLVAPTGIMVSIVALGAGIGLWVWKDPGGLELAVAGTAFDGTPLTPEQYAQLNQA